MKILNYVTIKTPNRLTISKKQPTKPYVLYTKSIANRDIRDIVYVLQTSKKRFALLQAFWHETIKLAKDRLGSHVVTLGSNESKFRP